MPITLRGRHLLSLRHHSDTEIRYLVDPSRDLKRAKYAGTERPLLQGRNIALIFESPANLAFDQAENRMHTIKAALVASLA